jgi:hypothetical protein
MTPDKRVNLYQSHDQSFTGYAMAKPPLKRPTSEDATGPEALARSLNKAFYITSYQSEITRYAPSGSMTYYLRFLRDLEDQRVWCRILGDCKGMQCKKIL